MNLTLSVDDRLVEEARRVAAAMGKSLNQVVREYLEALTSMDAARLEIEELRRLSKQGGGRSRGWRFDREELHERA
jgi:antitoxin component of RelBE/YafQ-DinJ toxin-antitoxin module